MGVAIGDYDGDGRPDIFVSNDGRPHFLYHNEGNGSFQEEAQEAGAGQNENGGSVSGMGASFGDFDNDGLPDLIVTDLAKEMYELYHNVGRRTFASASRTTGLASISALRSGWGVQWLDYDNDGWKDLFVAQGHAIDNIQLLNPLLAYALPPLLARNVAGRFQDVSALSGPVFQDNFPGRGVAVGDLNNDGAIDVVVNVLNGTPKVLINRPPHARNHWLTLRLEGTRSNRDGQGASIMLQGASGAKQWQYATTAGSYLSAQDPRIHFGLGMDASAARIEIRWPSGIIQLLTNVKADRIITVAESGGQMQ